LKENGIKQKEIADLLDVSENTLGKWCSGDGVPEWAIWLTKMFNYIREKNPLFNPLPLFFENGASYRVYSPDAECEIEKTIDNLKEEILSMAHTARTRESHVRELGKALEGKRSRNHHY
jgi:transcriptional regulator with XRE-family HTH domain